MPNRIVALLPSGAGAAAAGRAVEAANGAWASWLRRVWRLHDQAPLPVTPGFPLIQWVCVPAGSGGYEEQWRRAQRLLAARRRVRDFAPVPDADWRRRDLCSLAPRWPAERTVPPRVPRHEEGTRLSAVGWVKRRWAAINDADGFPSTASIASAPYRRAILERLAETEISAAVADLEQAARVLDTAPEIPVPGLAPLIPEDGPGRWLVVRGGPWVYEERWAVSSIERETGERGDLDEIAATGRRAARQLRGVMEKLGVPLTNHLAVIAADLDGMGRFLSGESDNEGLAGISVTPDEHRRVSEDLLEAAAEQRRRLRSSELLAVPVYLGGDDLLAFSPARFALTAAKEGHDAIRPSLPPTSTAVLYFHYRASIQEAMSEARRMLDLAKKRVPGKRGLAVGYLRRSGTSATSIQPWLAHRDTGETSAEFFGLFARAAGRRLSPRLAADLHRDAGELAALAQVRPELYLAELTRLVRRHSEHDGGGRDDGAAEVARALTWLGEHEHAPVEVTGPHTAAQVGVFLRQEGQ